MSDESLIANKKIVFVTGTRADFGKLCPLAMSLLESGANVSFFITGMHMMKKYGETRLEVRRLDGVEFFEYVNQKDGDALDTILSKTILGFSDFVHEFKPDLVVIHGDRVEAFAASIVCALNYIRSAHIEGGEVSGTIDESIRHCNSKLCATHFVSSELAARRVETLGESNERIFTIGSPELDIHHVNSGISIGEVKTYYEIPFTDYGVVIFHPVASEVESMYLQAQSLFSALMETDRPYVVIAPNNDPGHEDIFCVIDSLPSSRFRIIPSMRFNYFSELMKNASIMVGNSSAGVREAPFLGIPSINIGTRQNERTKLSTVIHHTAFDIEEIVESIENKWGRREEKSSLFGSGDSCMKFKQVLNEASFWNIPKQKVFINIL